MHISASDQLRNTILDAKYTFKRSRYLLELFPRVLRVAIFIFNEFTGKIGAESSPVSDSEGNIKQKYTILHSNSAIIISMNQVVSYLGTWGQPS